MARGSDINARLNLDSKGAEKKLDSFSGKLGGLAKHAKGPAAIAVALTAVGAAAAVAGVKVFQATAQLQLGASKIATVFGDQIGGITSWADTVRLEMGSTRQEVLMLAAGFQDLLIPMGFSREVATGMTKDVVGLSAALSEWSGGTVTAAQVANIFSKAMLGEREQLKTLGISITELDVKNKLLAAGQEKLTGNALAQAKAVATQALIFEKSVDAQENYKKGGDSLARTQKALLATLKQMKEDVLTSLIPAMVEIGNVLRTDVIPQLTIMGQWLGENLPSKIEATVDALKGLKKQWDINALAQEIGGGGIFGDSWASKQYELFSEGLVFQAQKLGAKVISGATGGAVGDVDDRDLWYQTSSRIARRYFQDLEAQNLALKTASDSLREMNDETGKLALGIHSLELPVTQLTEATRSTVPTLVEHIRATAAAMEASKLLKTAMDEQTHASILEYEATTAQLQVGNALVDQINLITNTENARKDALKALNESLEKGWQDFRDKQMRAMVEGETERRDFLKTNNQEIKDNVVAMMDAMKRAGYTNADIARIDIVGILTEELWKQHLKGVKAALVAEERLRQERFAQAMKNADNTQKLALAITRSIEIAKAEGTYDPTQTQEMYRYAGLSGQLQRWMRNQDGTGWWGGYGGQTEHALPTAHSGGRIGGPIGQETPIMALGGETVLPIGAKQGITINFNGLVAGDPAAIGQEIAEILNKSSVANGAIINSSAVTS
jgi:hypothetical protein